MSVRLKIKYVLVKILIGYKRYVVKQQWRNTVRKHKTGYRLTREQKKEVRELFGKYKKTVFDFHKYYTGNTGEFYSTYMPDDIYYNYVDRFYNDWEKAKLLDNKCMYEKYFSGIKLPETVLLKMNGVFLSKDYEILTRDDILETLINEEEIFIKVATESDGGRGVFCLRKDEIRKDALRILLTNESDMVVQKPIKQHPRMAMINNSSVNSIRVISLLRENEVKVYSCIVRMGMQGSRVDNVSSGAISCGVDEFGRLRKYAYGCYGGRVDRHPTSGLMFEGFQIPSYDKVINITKKLHCQMPYFRLISWDFSVDENGEPVLIEANFKYGALDFHQFGNGPLFGEDTSTILDEVFGKTKMECK